jgi:hypothetical protein
MRPEKKHWLAVSSICMHIIIIIYLFIIIIIILFVHRLPGEGL